jgi:hypothetical protein
MKSTKTTQNFAVALMVLFGLYGLSMLGLGATLLAYAVGLIVFSYNGNLELTAGAVILVGGVLHVMGRLMPARREGFNTQEGAQVIAARLQAIQKPYASAGPQGALSEITEGFADADTDGFSGGKKEETAVAAGSKPASVETTTDATKAEKSETKAGFTDESAATGLFKLGELPSEQKGDFHIDAGTTIIKALGALKPDQLKSMTEDTQKLMETQKSLMGMLNSMKPMLTDGQALISQFSGLLGNK